VILSALTTKLFRELWQMRGQALAIAMVVASGVATFVMSLSTLDSLQVTQATFYNDYRFAEVFVSLKRAPLGLVERIREIPGVDQVEPRVMAAVNLDIEDYPDPATGLLVSMGEHGESLLNRLYLREGRLPNPLTADETVVSEAFAKAHALRPGNHIAAIINGKRKDLEIVGVALSPEFIMQIKPGSMVPDFKAYAILWMARKPLATAYDMDGAFNDLALTLTAGAEPKEVIARLDALLARYGGLGAYSRDDQLSHRYLHEEFRQLESMATMFPAIFLGVAAFLLNVVFHRMCQTEREQIATLKAFGYSSFAIGLHYLQFVAWIAGGGIALGVAGGVWMGQGMTGLYAEFYRFPFMTYRLDPPIVLWAALISFGASFAGAVFAVRKAARQPPAEAMRPAPPARYGKTLIEKLGLGALLNEPTRMIARNIERRPIKALFTATGIAAAYAILIMGMFFRDSIDYMIDVQFWLAQRDDITVSFVEPTSYSAALGLQRMAGVENVEGFRTAPVRLRVGHRTYRTSILGLPPQADMYRLLNTDLQTVEPPSEGLLLTDYLADYLHAKPGDRIVVEVLEGRRPVREVELAGTISQFLGVSGYMNLDALNRFLQEGRALSGAYLAVDPAMETDIYARIKGMPRVAGTEIKNKAIASLRDTMGEQILVFAGVTTILAGIIAFGVVYNSARITLSERSRELASLRVLGFTRGEASYILLGELGILTLVALPLGMLLGRALSELFVAGFETDLFRIPLVLEPRTYAYSALVIIVCSVVSAWIVRRQIHRLDLVAVLKTRE